MTQESNTGGRRLIERLGVIGDVHAEDAALRVALQRFDQLGVTDIVCTGDVINGQGNAQLAISTLRDRNIPTVRGNHDRWFFDDEPFPGGTKASELTASSIEWLSKLPVAIEIHTVAGKSLLCHGLGGDDMGVVYPAESESDLVHNDALNTVLKHLEHALMINGHSHMAMARKISRGKWATPQLSDNLTILNAGTLRNDHSPCLMLVDFAALVVSWWRFKKSGDFEETPITVPLPL